MINIKTIRENPEAVASGLNKRGLDGSRIVSDILKKDTDHRKSLTDLEALYAKRKDAARNKDHETGVAVKAEITTAEGLVDYLAGELEDYLFDIPNVPANDVPVGKDEHDNQLVRVNDIPLRSIKDPKDHVEIGSKYGLDISAGVAMSGTRFSFMRGPVARLERVIGQYMLECQVKNGFEECSTPLLVKDTALYGTGQLPKFIDDLYSVNTDEHFLIPTAEVTLTNYVADKILAEGELPLRLTALTPCFRSEAGSAGKDTHGILRQHQFNKVEMVSITTPEKSAQEHEFMLSCAENILTSLGIKYRIMLLCAGDMGFGAQKTYDIEVWVPSQKTYREISSVSNCGDFQANRMKTRFTNAQGKKEPVHTLNGSGLAVGRTLLAVLENYQDEGGKVFIPSILQSAYGKVWL
jgi:seryl-tRNA synthetase